MEAKTTRKKNSFRLLIAIAFGYHHYEHFDSQIDLNKFTIAKGKPGNSLNKNCVHFLDAAPPHTKVIFF